MIDTEVYPKYPKTYFEKKFNQSNLSYNSTNMTGRVSLNLHHRTEEIILLPAKQEHFFCVEGSFTPPAPGQNSKK